MKMKNINKLFLLPIVAFVLLFSSCEDEPPNVYIQKYYVEGYLFVGENPKGIKVFKTQPIDTKYEYENAIVKNADVKLIDFEGNEHKLEYQDGEEAGYHYTGGDLIIQKQKEYKIEITTPDGKFMWARTLTPDTISWVTPPKEKIYYPKEDGKLPVVDSLRIRWTKAEDSHFYLLYTICLDTLNYGKYLDPPVEEPNRRIKNFISDQDESGDYYNNVTFTTIIANTETPTVWLAFKWFGLHNIDILVPDYNLLQWFVQTNWSGNQYDPLSSSIEGDGFGVFGSAYRISQETVLIKPTDN